MKYSVPEEFVNSLLANCTLKYFCLILALSQWTLLPQMGTRVTKIEKKLSSCNQNRCLLLNSLWDPLSNSKIEITLQIIHLWRRLFFFFVLRLYDKWKKKYEETTPSWRRSSFMWFLETVQGLYQWLVCKRQDNYQYLHLFYFLWNY